MSGQKIIDRLNEVLNDDFLCVIKRGIGAPPIIDRSAALPDGLVAYVSQEAYDGRMAQLDELCRFVNDLRIMIGYEPLDLPGLLDAVRKMAGEGQIENKSTA